MLRTMAATSISLRLIVSLSFCLQWKPARLLDWPLDLSEPRLLDPYFLWCKCD